MNLYGANHQNLYEFMFKGISKQCGRDGTVEKFLQAPLQVSKITSYKIL